MELRVRRFMNHQALKKPVNNNQRPIPEVHLAFSKLTDKQLDTLFERMQEHREDEVLVSAYSKRAPWNKPDSNTMEVTVRSPKALQHIGEMLIANNMLVNGSYSMDDMLHHNTIRNFELEVSWLEYPSMDFPKQWRPLPEKACFQEIVSSHKNARKSGICFGRG